MPFVCGWWWSCAYPYRHQIVVTAPTAVAVPAGYSVAVALDHGVMVSGGSSLASGDDLRTWVELNRVADPKTPFNNAGGATKLWFAIGADIPAGAADSSYYLYYGASTPGAPPADESAIFLFADFFDRADNAAVGRGWTVYDASSGYAGAVASSSSPRPGIASTIAP